MDLFKNKKILGIIASALFGVILLVIILLKYPFREVFSTFINFTPLLMLAYLVVSVLIMLTLSFRWKVILGAMGHKISFLKLVGYRIIGYGVSYITPSAKVGGEPVRAALLKRQDMSFREGLSSILIDKTIEISFSILFFVFGVVILLIDYAVPGKMLVVLIILSALFIYIIWSFYSRILKGKPVFTHVFTLLRLDKLKFLSKYQNVIYKFEKPIIQFYNDQRKEFFITSALSIISLALSLLEFKLVLLMLGINAPLGIVFMVLSFAGLAFLIPLPMALGSFEAFQISLFSILKIGSGAAGVGVAMITRSRDLLWVLVAVALSLYLGSLKNIISKAYGDRPVIGIGIIRHGKRHRLKIKINKPRINNKKWY